MDDDDGVEGGGWWMVKKDEEQLPDIQHTTLHGNQRKDQEYDGDRDDHENEALRATLRSV